MPVLECRELKKRFGGTEALAGVTLKLEPGRVAGLLGPNGAGKTTLIKLLCGLLQPDSGEASICGLAPGTETKKLVSYLPDRLALPEAMRAGRLLDFYGDFFADFDRPRAEGLLSRLGVDPAKRVKQLSRGEQEKVQLVLAMSRRAKLYLLDEPMGGVDPASRDYIISTIMANCAPGSSVLISTHLIQDVERVLDDVFLIDQGRIVMVGPADGLRERYGKSVDGIFREVFRCAP